MPIDKQAVLKYLAEHPLDTLTETARVFGCSREYIRQVCSGHGLHEGQSRRSAKAHARRLSTLEKRPLHLTRACSLAWDECERNGIECVAAVQFKHRRYEAPRSDCFIANGHIVRAYACSNHMIYGTGLTERTHFGFGNSTPCDFRVFIQQFDKEIIFYVIPESLLDTCDVFIPCTFREVPYRNAKTRIDWRKYRDAWHLLKEKPPRV